MASDSAEGADGLTLRVYVQPRAAIVAGRTVVGAVTLRVRDEDLVPLSPVLREELAEAYAQRSMLGQGPDDPPVSEPTLAAVVPVLAARVAARARAAEAAAAEAAAAAQVATQAAQVASSRDVARTKALRTWVAEHGDAEMRARLAEGFLPEQEILDAVVDDLLDLRGFISYEPMFKSEVCACGCGDAVVFTATSPPTRMEANEFARLQAVREAVPPGAVVIPTEHRGACPRCRCLPTVRLAAKVTCAWEGWLLVREFLLK